MNGTVLENILPKPAIRSNLVLSEEDVSLELLKAKFPNVISFCLSSYRSRCFSPDYLTQFCQQFPAIERLEASISKWYDVNPSNAMNAIASLRYLRKLHLEIDCDGLSLVKMPQLEVLRVCVKIAHDNLQLLTDVNNFPALKMFRLHTDDEDEMDNFVQVIESLEKFRPEIITEQNRDEVKLWEWNDADDHSDEDGYDELIEKVARNGGGETFEMC